MELQELNDKYLDLIDSLLDRYNMADLRKELTFGEMKVDEDKYVDAVFVQLGSGADKKGVLTSLEDRPFSIDVESLILEIRAAKQEVPESTGTDLLEGLQQGET